MSYLRISARLALLGSLGLGGCVEDTSDIGQDVEAVVALPCAVTLTMDPPAGATAGTPVHLSATASGAGCPSDLRYRFTATLTDGSGVAIGPANIVSASVAAPTGWGTAPEATWITESALDGSYTIEARARDTGAVLVGKTSSSFSLARSPSCTGVAFAPPATATVGATLVLAPSGACQGFVSEHRFRIRPSRGTWDTVSNWGSASSYTWNTTGLAPGTYEIDYKVRRDFESVYVRGWQAVVELR
ncbi:MAG: hypothetical protein H6719_05305 [Sandaracinaceae bacterium]|nr:hypothetical protein [Sandaracinaceae bacterium]